MKLVGMEENRNTKKTSFGACSIRDSKIEMG